MKNRNIHKLLIGLVAILLLTACQEWLTIEPENKIVKENFWKTKEDVDAVVASTYNKLRDIVNEEFLWGEVRGDLFTPGTRITNDYLRVMEGNIFPDNSIAIWDDYYKIVNQANLVMDNAPGVRDIDLTFTKEELDVIVGQMLFLRSFCFFTLAKTFRDIPMPLEAFENDYQEFQIGQVAQKDVFLQIIEDLKTAEQILPESHEFKDTYLNFKGKVSKYAAKAMMADVYLWLNEPQLSIQKCDEVITSGKYSLLGMTYWFKIFRQGFTNESIFEIYSSIGDGQPNRDEIKKLSSNTSFTNLSHKYFDVSGPKMDLFKSDPRGDLKTVAYSPSVNDRTLWKWIGGSDLSVRDYRYSNDVNWIIYRFAEMFLIKAEAAIMLDDYTTAREAIGIIRGRAGATPLALADDAGKYYWYQAVLNERFLEFSGEGKRWHDLVRIASKDNYEYKDLLVEPIMDNAELSVKVLLKSKIGIPGFWYLPIHENELRVNKNLIQNEFYKTN